MFKLVRVTLFLSVVATGSLEAQTSNLADRLFWGGSLGLSFGTVDFVDLSPMIGVDLTSQVAAGAQLIFRYRDDSSVSPSLSTTDYGGRVFGRYSFTQLPVFLQAEYEHLNYEYRLVDGRTDRSTLDNVLAGGGYAQAVGPNTALSVTALYNFTFDDADPGQPYADPWVLRFGVSVGF